ncbi:glutamate--cysteine ligase [Gurleya vavrai]
MLESTPSTPHSSLFKDLKNVEECMSFRIRMIRSELNKLEPNSFPLLVTCFPKLGMYESIFDSEELLYKVTRSLYFPDNAITKHKRFYSFVRNIINRRGRKIEGYIKIMECNINQEKEINEDENKQSGESYVKEISLLNEGDLNQTLEFNSKATDISIKDQDKQNKNSTFFIMDEKEQNEDINRDAINLLTGENLNNIQTENTKEGANIFLSKENEEVNKNLIKGINTEITYDQSQFDNLENVAEKLKDSNEEEKNLYNRQIISTNDLGMESKKIMQDLEENIKVIQNLQINENESIKTGNTYNDNNPFEQSLINDKNVLPGHIRIDSMGQGMGCCCLQLTIQASIMSEARVLYDMLGTVCPLLLRLTRATPISQGKLLSTETRWDMLVFSVDCRTDEERGCAYNISGNIESDYKDKENKKLIRKSRFSSMDMFISDDKRNLDYYNDLDVPLHEESYKILKGCVVDEKMARHIASLFIRDPILVYKNDENMHNTEDNIDSEKNSKEIEEKSNEILNSKKESNKSVLKSESEKVDYLDETQKSIKNDSNDKSEKNHDKKNIKCEKCINENFNECFHINAGDEKVKRIKNENIISDTNKIKVEQMTLNENDKEVLTYKSISSSSYDKNVKEKRKFFTDDFENIQSSNWRSMRFKLPSQNGRLEESGWKVEFRPMEIQPTAFENSAYCIFVVLLSKAIIEYKINFYMPLSLVDENFRRANLLNYKESEFKKKLENDRAIFYYRKNIFEEGKANICEGTIKDIFMGDGDYEGIFGVVKRFVDEHYNKKENCEEEKSNIYKYLNFLEKRINNEYVSVADFMRKFVITHEDYKNDANASEKILDELIDKVKIITEENSVEYLINK